MPREPMREIVAGVDDSLDPAALLELAAAEAALRSAPLTLVAVSAQAGPAVLQDAVRRVRVAHPALVVRIERLSGDPATALLSRSAGASLLMLERGDRRGGGRTGSRGSGSLAATVLGGATVPVVICPSGGSHPGDGPVVVGIDGTPGSEAALRFGFAAADLRHAPLTATHLWPPLVGPGPGYSGASAAEDAFLDLLETWSGKYPDVPVRLAVRHGVDAAIVLAAASRSAQLVVVASAASDAAVSPMLAALAVRATCPVAVVPSAA